MNSSFETTWVGIGDSTPFFSSRLNFGIHISCLRREIFPRLHTKSREVRLDFFEWSCELFSIFGALRRPLASGDQRCLSNRLAIVTTYRSVSYARTVEESRDPAFNQQGH